MKKLLILSSLLLISCASGVKTVHIPVPVESAKVTMPPAPPLPIHDLDERSQPDIVLKSYVVSTMMLQQQNNELRQKLEVCQ